MAATISSPGVVVQEVDISQVVSQGVSSIGAIVGFTKKGPINKRNLATSVSQFVNQSGNPDSTVSYMQHSAIAALDGLSRLWWVRVADGAKFAGVIANISGTSTSTALPSANAAEDLDEFFIPNIDSFRIPDCCGKPWCLG